MLFPYLAAGVYQLLFQGNHARYDLAVRAWATQEPAVAELVTRADELRMTFVRSLFEEMGFAGDELEMRTQTCVIYYNFLDGFSIDMSKNKDAIMRQNQLRHRLLTKP